MEYGKLSVDKKKFLFEKFCGNNPDKKKKVKSFIPFMKIMVPGTEVTMCMSLGAPALTRNVMTVQSGVYLLEQLQH